MLFRLLLLSLPLLRKLLLLHDIIVVAAAAPATVVVAVVAVSSTAAVIAAAFTVIDFILAVNGALIAVADIVRTAVSAMKQIIKKI